MIKIPDFKELVFVGIDPHKDQHVAVMIDHWGELFFKIELPNNPTGFSELMKMVNLHTPTGKTAVFGIEDTGGLGRACAQWLRFNNQMVKGVNPIFSSQRRGRQPHRAKNDVIDATAVARVLIEEFDTLPIVIDDRLPHALRQLVNRRDQLVRNSTRSKNRLHKLIHENYHNYKEFFSDPFGVTALAFWHKYPHPGLLKNVGPNRLANFMGKHSRNQSRSKAELILSLVDKNQTPSAEDKIIIAVIRQLIEEIQQTKNHIKEMEKLISEQLAESDTHLRTMPGVGDVTAASILSRVGSIVSFDSASKLARHAGIAPEDYSSGATTKQRRSKSGDRQLNAAIHRIALNQIGITKNGDPKCPVAHKYYQRKISEGKSKLSALTCLKRRICDIIYAMLRDKSKYLEQKPKKNLKAKVA